MAGEKKATIRDVAAAAGVSVTTVSDALSGKGRLPEATRLKVQSIAEGLNFRPSAIARGLRGDGLGLVGICIAPAGGGGALTDVGYWATIVTNASQALLDRGLAPVLLPHDVSRLAKLKIPLDGAIVIDPLEGDPVLAYLLGKKVPCVLVGRDLSRGGDEWVDDDNRNGVMQMLSDAVPAGARVAFIKVGPTKSYVLDALDGAQDWARRATGSVDEIVCGGLNAKDVAVAVAQATARGAQAILAQNNRLAIAILAALREQGRQIPTDVRLLSVVDAPELELASPAISAVCQHPGRLAEIATDALIQLTRERKDPSQTVVPTDVALRASAPRLLRPLD